MNNAFYSQIKRIVILGHTGFIGSRLAVLFRRQSPEIEITGRALPELDLTRQDNALALTDLFDLNTAVIMCSGIKKQLGDSPDIFSQNLKMTENLCRVLQEKPVRRFIYFSSAEVYGEDIHNMDIREDTPVNPRSYYGMAKYISECLLRKVIESCKDSSLLVLRPPLVYGPGDMSRGYGPSGFAWLAAGGKEITLWGDGSEYREFLFVDDLIKIVHYLTFQDCGGLINVASGKSYTFKDVLGFISGFMPFEIKINSRPRTKQKVDQGFCNAVLMRLVPDFSFTSLKDGIKCTLDAEQEVVMAGTKGVKGDSR